MNVGNALHYNAHSLAGSLDQLHIGAPTWARMAERWLMPLG